jgi:hypothetical protein
MIPLWKGKNPIYFWVIRSKVKVTAQKWWNATKLLTSKDLIFLDPKINRVLPLPQRNHVARFGKDPIYRTKIIVWKPVWMTARPLHPIT